MHRHNSIMTGRRHTKKKRKDLAYEKDFSSMHIKFVHIVVTTVIHTMHEG